MVRDVILQPVEVTTMLGAVYRFPDVSYEDLRRALKDMNGALFGSFTITNLSGAATVIPLRIMQEVSFGGTVVWKRADSPA